MILRSRQIARGIELSLRDHRPFLRLAGCFCAVLASTLWAGLEDNDNLIWVANGVLLAYLLVVPRWRWLRYLVTAFLALLVGGVVVSPHRWQQSLVLSVLNLLEVGIAAVLLRNRSAQLPQFTNRRYLLRFLRNAAFIAPLIAGAVFALLFALWIKGDVVAAFRRWTVTDALGNTIATPACVVLLQMRLRRHGAGRSLWLFEIAVVLVTIAAFCQ